MTLVCEESLQVLDLGHVPSRDAGRLPLPAFALGIEGGDARRLTRPRSLGQLAAKLGDDGPLTRPGRELDCLSERRLDRTVTVCHSLMCDQALSVTLRRFGPRVGIANRA